MLFWSTIIYFIRRHGLQRTVNLQQTNATCVKCVFQQQNSWHTQVSDARSQLRFLEEIESLQKKKRDEEERERLLHFARVGGARIRLHSYQKQSLHSNTISVFRLNVSLKTTTENSLCIKSWVTCLITEPLPHWRSRVSAAQAKSQRGAFPSPNSPQELALILPPFMLVFVSSVYSGRHKLLLWLQVVTVKKEHVYKTWALPL